MSQKIVINKCYGGFSLSYEGVMLYAKLKGIKIYAFVSDASDYRKYLPYKGKGREPFCIHYKTVSEMVEQKRNKDGLYEGNKTYFSDRDIERNDIFLIKVVEKLGDRANGRCAELEITEIPDGVKWVIDEYDGMEHVEEEHRSW